MVDSIYHNVAAGQFVVTISHYPEPKEEGIRKFKAVKV